MDTAVDYIYGMNNSGSYFMNTDVVVVAGAKVSSADIVVMGSHVLENNGIVSSDIDVCDGCRLEIYNRGVFNAKFTLGDGASVVQVVTDDIDINPLGINVDYNLRVIDADGIKLSDIMRVGEDANEILLRDSSVVWDVANSENANLKLSGVIKLEFDDIKSVIGRPIVSSVTTDTYLYVTTNGVLAPMFSMNSYVENGSAYLQLVRETDYTKFLDNNLGEFINSLDADLSAIGLRYRLDNAMSMNEIDKIMADSVRIAPINMMDTVAVINAMDMNSFDYETGAGGNYTVIDDNYAYGVFANGNINLGKFSAGIRGYANSLSLIDSFDVFSGFMFGGNVYAKYEDDSNFVRSMIGGNITRFDITNVFDGWRGVDNPTGYSIYGAFDAGHRFEFRDGFMVSSYVGATVNYMTILHMDDSIFSGRIGVDAVYGFKVLGIKYDYAIRTVLNTNNEISLGGRIGFMSEFDMVGGHVAIDYLNSEAGRGYRISAGMNIKF